MLAGLLLFGAVTWFVARQGNTAALAPERARLYLYIFIALAASALAGMIAIRSRLASAGSPGQAVTLYLVGYAFAEGAALFGGVAWFLGASIQLYVAGLLVVAAGFQILPVRADDSGLAR